MELRRYTLALEDISLVKIATFMKLRVTERVRGSTKRQCIWIIEASVVKGDLWFLSVFVNFVTQEAGPALKESASRVMKLDQLQAKAQSGDPEAITELANLYRAGYAPLVKNEHLAFELYSKAARANYPPAQMCLAVCYEIGLGVNRDLVKSFEWFSLAGESNVPDALYKLGMCYEDGIGTTQDHKEAFRCYCRAAETGDAIAQNNVGVYYDRGTGIERNPELAVYWYEKAAEQGHASAQNNFGACMEEGVGVKKSLPCAIYWYTKAAEQGDQIAQNNLGHCYHYGIGVGKDPFKALQYYQKAAYQGYEPAQTVLGKCYYKGFGVPKDYALSAYWFTKAVEQESDVAHYYLGKMYLHGVGVPQNYKLAFKTLSASHDERSRSRIDKHLKKFCEAPILNKLLASDWPSYIKNLHPTCKTAILELLCVSRHCEHNFPNELFTEIVQQIILVWPHPHSPIHI
jgi:TPR repeat protein